MEKAHDKLKSKYLKYKYSNLHTLSKVRKFILIGKMKVYVIILLHYINSHSWQ